MPIMITTDQQQSYIEHLSDQEVVDAILKRDKNITYEYLYKKCYSTFYVIWRKYHTDCLSCLEFITDVYIQIMTPSKITGKSSLENFKVKSSFEGWLRIVAQNRCKLLYKEKMKIGIIPVGDEVPNGQLTNLAGSNDIDLSNINKEDLEIVLAQVKPIRFRQIIELVHLKGMTNEEASKVLKMSSNNFNTKHHLARNKVKSILEKEGLL